MKILLAGPYPKGTTESMQALLTEHELMQADTQDSYDNITDVDIIVVRVLKTTASTMSNKKNLKAVIRWGAGYDSVDIEAAGSQGVLVATTPGANAYAVSELAVALMLNIGRKIHENNQKTHSGIWDNKIYSNMMTTLNHKVVGIIGGGNIGRSVARQVQSFGAKAIYYDAFRLKEDVEQEYHMKFVDLDTLVQTADVITLHVPLLDSTKHILNAERLQKMKNHVIIINTARGGLIDDSALKKALDSGKVLGAGLDCVEDEDMSKNPLVSLDNVIITPHMGGTSNDLPNEMVPRIAEQIKSYASNRTIKFVVNEEFLKN